MICVIGRNKNNNTREIAQLVNFENDVFSKNYVGMKNRGSGGVFFLICDH